MTDNSKAGIALLLGSVGGAIAMAIHPTLATTQSAHLAVLSGIAHSLALISIFLLFLGTCRVAQFLSAPDRLAFTALIAFGFSSTAVMIAAAVSGWVIPGILRLMAHDVPAAASTWHVATASIFQLNQALSRIYSVGTCAAILLWSIAGLRQKSLPRGIAIYGYLSGPAIALLIGIGHLRLDVHGMAVVMLSEVIWFAGLGLTFLRSDRPTPSSRNSDE